MPFTTALSGLNAASNNLAVTGNNIANANTTGFKKSRSEFADVFGDGLGSTQPGSGVRVAAVAQQFSQGNLQFTENNFDLAISGEGFFTLAENPALPETRVYTRSGEFKIDDSGNVVNNQGNALLVYKANGEDAAEGFSLGVLQTLNMTEQGTNSGLPTATSEVAVEVNLDARNVDDLTNPPAPAVYQFDPTDPATYTKQTSTNMFDSLGDSYILTTFFVAGPNNPADPPNNIPETRDWYAFNFVNRDGDLEPVNVDPTNDPGAIDENASSTLTGSYVGTTLSFDPFGKLYTPSDGKIQLDPYDTNTSANDIVVEMDYTGSTHLASAFSVDALSQDGVPAGRLTNIDVDNEGVVFARFSNGKASPLGKVALTRFVNTQGLQKIGDSSWEKSPDSGEPIAGEAGTNNFGMIQSGALEGANVDLTRQLVNLIIAQQAYQANAETISTEDSIVQSILNIR
jgi:flagellar hook protein FlgE